MRSRWCVSSVMSRSRASTAPRHVLTSMPSAATLHVPAPEAALTWVRVVWARPHRRIARDVRPGSKALFVYVSGCAEGSWTMPTDLAALDPTQLRALPNCAPNQGSNRD